MKTALWLNVDPLAEKMPNFGSFVYVFNNPVRFVDPDGKMAIDPPSYSNGNAILSTVGTPGYMKMKSIFFGGNSQRILTQNKSFNGVVTIGSSTSENKPISSFIKLGSSLSNVDFTDPSEISNTASVTTVSVSGTFKDEKGNTVSSSKDASILIVNKREKTEKVFIDIEGRVSNSVSVKTVVSSTTYGISKNSDGDSVLSKPRSLVNTENKNIPLSSSSKDMREHAFQTSKKNIETKKEIFDNHNEGLKNVLEKVKE
ncbi:hypothetical protein HNQ02_002987 [Flavobacterium sp. 7E]|nr:hypothetical protein [Flavobacterium sp. 7E]